MPATTGPRKHTPAPGNLPKPAPGHLRVQTHNGWSWAIEVPGEGYRVRDATGKLRAKNARTWKIAAEWALAHCWSEE